MALPEVFTPWETGSVTEPPGDLALMLTGGGARAARRARSSSYR